MNLISGWTYILSWSSCNFIELRNLGFLYLLLFLIILWWGLLLLSWIWLWRLLIDGSSCRQLDNRSWLLINWIWVRSLIIGLAKLLFLLYLRLILFSLIFRRLVIDIWQRHLILLRILLWHKLKSIKKLLMFYF